MPGGMDLSAEQWEVVNTYLSDVAAAKLWSLRDTVCMVAGYIRQGPWDASWLYFFGGVLNVLYSVATIVDIFHMFLEPVTYAISLYQLAFGLVSCAVVAPEEWKQRRESVQDFQDFITTHLKFLDTGAGKGLFYIFQGILLLSMNTMSVSAAIGYYVVVIGAFWVAMHYKSMMSVDGESDTRDTRGQYIAPNG